VTATAYRVDARRDLWVARRAWRTFGISITAMTAAGVAEAGAGLVATAVLAHVTSLADAGRVFFAQTAAVLLFNVVDPRLEDAVIRFVPRLPAQQAAGLFGRCLALDVAIGAVGGLVAAAFVLTLSATSLLDPSYLLLAVLASSLAAGYGTASAAFSVTDGLHVLGWIRLAVAVGGIPVVVAGAVSFGGAGFLVAQALLAVVATAAVVGVGRRRVRRSYGDPSPVRLAAIPGVLPFAVKGSIGTTLLIALDRLPLAVLGLVGGPVPVAIFRIAMAPARLLWTLMSPISAVLFPWLSQRSAAGRAGELRAPLRQTSLVAVPAAVAFSAVAVPLLHVLVPALFGSKYADAVPVAALLLLAAALRNCVPWSKVLLLALGRPGLRLFVVAGDGLAVTLVTLLLSSSLVAVAVGHVVVAAAVVVTWLLIAERALARDGERTSVVADGGAR